MCSHQKGNEHTIVIVYTYEKSEIDEKYYKIKDYAYCYLCGEKFTVSP